MAWSSKAQGTGEFTAKLKRKKPVTRELEVRSKARCFDFDLRLLSAQAIIFIRRSVDVTVYFFFSLVFQDRASASLSIILTSLLTWNMSRNCSLTWDPENGPLPVSFSCQYNTGLSHLRES